MTKNNHLRLRMSASFKEEVLNIAKEELHISLNATGCALLRLGCETFLKNIQQEKHPTLHYDVGRDLHTITFQEGKKLKGGTTNYERYHD